MEIKNEIRKLHKNYVQTGKPDSIIINLEHYPDVDWCFVHEDKKGWGCYRRGNKFYHIGRNNQFCLNSITSRGGRDIFRKKATVISSNPEIRRVYEGYFKTLSYSYMYDLHLFLQANPYLVTNIWDFPECRTHKYNTITTIINSALHHIDYTKPTLTEACGLSKNYVKILAELDFYETKNVKMLKDHNFSPEETKKYVRCTFDNIVVKYRFERTILERLYQMHESKDWIKRNNYIDYLNMIADFPKEIKKDFPTCPQDIQKYHNKAINVFNTMKNEILARKNKQINDTYCNQVRDKIREFEYSNEEYSIIAPEHITDLVTEGQTLSHCVGSYMNRVVNELDYILFLRKNEEINIPYFTINITPNRNLVQIHGKYNCNVPKELSSFVDSWMVKFKITGFYIIGK